MNPDHIDLEKIEDGLSNKLIYRITEKENTKIIIDFSRDKKEFKNFLTVYEILEKIRELKKISGTIIFVFFRIIITQLNFFDTGS